MLIKIDALDTLFFRDGKPFTMGQETWADGIFPPHPSTVYGALRSAYFADHVGELNKANCEDDPTMGLVIKGMFLEIENDLCLPLPLDCVKEKGKSENDRETFLLKLKENTIVSNMSMPYVLHGQKDIEVKTIHTAYLDNRAFKKYLDMIMKEFYYMNLSDYVLTEEKIGIARDRHTNIATEGKLYRVDLCRLDNVSIIIDFEGLDLPGEGFLKLGGEGKVVAYKQLQNLPDFKPNLEGNWFKLYLLTPSIFKGGWLPGWIDTKTLEGTYKGLRLKLLSAVVGRHISIGGFDIKKGRPKPMRRAVPAGSVYYFELLKGELDDVTNLMHYKSISEYDAEQGFGVSFVGRV